MESNKQVAVIGLDQVERMAVAFAKSGLFGIRTPEQAVALMLIAQAEGLHPAVAARDYHVIQGRPALKADAMLARFQQAGGKVVWNAYSDSEVSGTFSHPSGGAVTVAWTIAQAKAAGLTGKDVWKQYPRAMLRARVVSEGIRSVYPGVSVGVYTPEEIEDFDAKPPTKEVSSVPVPERAWEPAKSDHRMESRIESGADQKKITLPKPVDPEKKAALEALKKSTWSKEEMSSYAKAAFAVESSASLTIEQLKLLGAVCTQVTFQQAMAEQQAAAEAVAALAQDSFDGVL
jgi:hypothetical protein